MVVFLFNQKTAYDMRISDWSSDVCSSDLIAVIPFDHADEAAALANDVAFGLSASIFTENINQAHATALALRVGTVWVNTWLNRDLRYDAIPLSIHLSLLDLFPHRVSLPFGGQKQSGIGREGGKFSLDFFTEKKTVCIQVHAPAARI